MTQVIENNIKTNNDLRDKTVSKYVTQHCLHAKAIYRGLKAIKEENQ